MPDGIACLAWSHEGSLLAMGTAGARVCMHDSVGARVAQAPCRSAVIAMAWSPTRCAQPVAACTILGWPKACLIACLLQAKLLGDADVGWVAGLIHASWASREGEDERLVVGCADGSVSFFSASGSVIGHHVALGSPIAALAPFSSGASSLSLPCFAGPQPLCMRCLLLRQGRGNPLQC